MNLIPAELRALCRELRRKSTDPERLLWRLIRNRGLDGLKFRRQHPVGPYVLDFFCADARLGIELDGNQHAAQSKADERRSRFLEERGIKAVRYWNDVVLENTEGVLEDIMRHVCDRISALEQSHLLKPSP